MANLLTQRRIFRPFKPDAVNGLCMWVDSSDPGMFTLSGDAIASLRERSPNGLVFSASTPAARPLYVPDGLNGKPVIRCDGIDDEIKTTGQPASFWYGSGTQQITWIYLVAYINTGRWSLQLAETLGGNTNRMILDRQPSGVGNLDFQFTAGSTGGQITTAPYLSPITAWAIETVRWTNGGTPTLRRTTTAATNTYSAGSTLTGTMADNQYAAIGSSILTANFNLAEWMIFNRNIDDSEAFGIERYLLAKWGTI